MEESRPGLKQYLNTTFTVVFKYCLARGFEKVACDYDEEIIVTTCTAPVRRESLLQNFCRDGGIGRCRSLGDL